MANAEKVNLIFNSDICQGTDFVRTASQTYSVVFASNTVYAPDALNATDGSTAIPVKGQFHPSDVTLTVKTKTVSRRGRVGEFYVVVNYATNSIAIGGNRATTPLDRPTIWSSRPQSSIIEIDRDAAGNLLLTSAKQVVRRQIRHNDEVLIAVKNLPEFTDYTAYFDKVNSASYRSRAAKTLYLGAPSQDFTEEEFEGDIIDYWTSTWAFEFLVQRATADPATWEERILNEGTVQLDDGTPAKQIQIQDPRTKAIISAATKLDVVGKVLPIAGTPLFLNDAGAAPTAGGLVDVYNTVDFNSIGL